MLNARDYDWQTGQPLHIDKPSMWGPGRLLRGPALRSHRPHAEGLGRAEHDFWTETRRRRLWYRARFTRNIRLVQAEMKFGRPVLRTALLHSRADGICQHLD